MRRLHAYLLKAFAAGFAISLASVLLLYIVIDLSTNLGQFLEAGRGHLPRFIAAYYVTRVPLIAGKLAPLAALLAAAFTLAFFEKRNELVPIKASGISMQRFTRPLVVAALLVTAASLALEEWAVPWASRKIYMENLEASEPHLWNQLVPDRANDLYVFYIAYYTADERLEMVHVSRVDDQAREREFLYADEGRPDTVDGKRGWRLERGYRILYDEKGLRVSGPDPFDTWFLETRLRPADMENRSRPDEMSLSSLARQWRTNPSLHALGVRFHFRAAFPVAGPILVWLGLPLILAGAHRRYFLGALSTALLAGAYFAVAFLALRLGMNGAIPPFLAGWGPAALFGALAFAVHDRMPT